MESDKLEALKNNPLWHEVTDKQREFILAYIETDGDKTKAAYQVWNPGSEKAAQSLGSRMLRKYAVRALLSQFYGTELKGAHVTRGELLSLISMRLRNANSQMREFNALSGLYADLKGWKSKAPGGRRNVNEPDEPEILSGDPEDDIMKLVYKMEQERKRKREEDEED